MTLNFSKFLKISTYFVSKKKIHAIYGHGEGERRSVKPHYISPEWVEVCAKKRD